MGFSMVDDFGFVPVKLILFTDDVTGNQGLQVMPFDNQQPFDDRNDHPLTS